MNPSERAEALKALQRSNLLDAFRPGSEFNTWRGRVAALLAFSPKYQSEFSDAAERIFISAYSQETRQDIANEVEALVTQAIAELEIQTDQAAPPVALVAAPPSQLAASSEFSPLTDEHGILWFWHHCRWSIRWRLLALIATAFIAVGSLGFALGRNNFFVQFFDLIHASTNPTKTP